MPEAHLKPAPIFDEDGEVPPLLASTEALPALATLPAYTELHCLTHFSFQRGASSPGELVRRAYKLGYSGLAITDECSVAGAVRAWSAWREYRAFMEKLEAERPGERYLRLFQLIYGAQFKLGAWRVVALARDLAGWGGLCEFISAARMSAPKGEYTVSWDASDWSLLQGCDLLLCPQRGAIESVAKEVQNTPTYERFFSKLALQTWLAAELHHHAEDDAHIATLRELAAAWKLPLVATGGVCMHLRSRKPLHDVMTAVSLGRAVDDCGFALQANAERHLRARTRLARIYPREWLDATQTIAARCTFQLEEVRYNYPRETVPAGLTPIQGLRALTLAGARERYPKQRYPKGIPWPIKRFLVKELKLIATCEYEMFFLTVHDIVRFAKSRGILCQGRGSAANSVVCYCLGITAADPEHSHPLLERFISLDRRTEPPDIDVDFEHERREEVIQYIYRKYGRERAALAATVIAYRTRSAVRDVGKALSIPEPLIDIFASEHHWFDKNLARERLSVLAERANIQIGREISERRIQMWLDLSEQIMGTPRHLSQHVGGFVLTQTRLTQLVPVENAAMPDRSVIQWDKDDLEALGLMKVDVLALGMLTAIARSVRLVAQKRGQPFSVYDIVPECAQTFAMARRADTVGVFQIESRAQMSMLPRLKPTTFYDLVVEVAIVRPGPISGGMVHPYLQARERRRQGLPIHYERSSLESPDRPAALEAALERTLGVPIFQEQVMQIAMIAAGFSATEADSLRRAMAAWKRKGGVHRFHDRLVQGMLQRGYSLDFAERIFSQIQGFGEYGFPESHAYSFALLAYQSAWLKCHEPDCFLVALLNSQPMGFYTPSQLIQDAQRHGIEVRSIDVTLSDWNSELEPGDSSQTAWPVRLGLHLVNGLSEAAAHRITTARTQSRFTSIRDLSLRAQLDRADLNALAAADALKSLAGHRRQQVWEAAAQETRAITQSKLLQAAPIQEAPIALQEASEGEAVVHDYQATGLTLRRHPLAILRKRLQAMRYKPAALLNTLPHGAYAAACGIVTVRQKPQTAKGTMFVTLEDETGPVNVIVWKSVRERQRDVLLRARLLAVHGVWQQDVQAEAGAVKHLIAGRIEDLSHLLGRLAELPKASRDFH